MKIKKYTRVTAFFLAVCTVLLMLPLSVRADEYWPDGVKTQSKSAIVMEVNTGTVLYEKKSHEKHYPASITKIMTVLLAIENCDMDEVVTFSADAVFKNEGDTSHIARNLGEKLTMEQCLYAVMLESANECAYAVAEHVGQKLGGDYRTFIDLMNKRAKELGCTDTHFNNCNGLPDEEIIEKLHDYHDNDIARSLEALTKEERIHLYNILEPEWVSEIFTFIEEPEDYIEEIGIDKLAAVINEMDSDDAVDLLEEIDESVKEKLRPILHEDVKADIQLIHSYDEEEIGSLMTTNYICIKKTLNIRQAMRELIVQAGESDNISTLYVVDENNKFSGAIDLKDLIIARENDDLDDLISYSYPYLLDCEKISDCIEKIKDYAEDSLPVLNDKKEIIGILTAQDVIEAVDDEMGEDYAKLAGLTAEEDLRETTKESMKKRLPWLIILLLLGMGVSTVVGSFEAVVAVIPIVICFQSLILDMAGNVGTQSLAVTIRVLMDDELNAKAKLRLVLKEMKVGFCNGLLLGGLAFVFLGLYIFGLKGYALPTAFLVSGCVGVSLLLAMVISSLVGTLVPLFFAKIKIDPAVASGPLITTVNDLVAVVTYYGLAWLFLIPIMG